MGFWAGEGCLPPPALDGAWAGPGAARQSSAGVSPHLASLCPVGEGSHCPRVLLTDPPEHVEALKAGLAPRGKRPPHC